MDKIQESYAGMFLKVKNFGTKNATKIATLAAIPPLFATHSTNTTDVFAADTGARADIRGYAIDKGIKRTVLETISLKLSNAITALATLNADNNLAKRADFTSSQWYSFSEEELVTQASIIRDLATPIIATLAPVGILPADLTALNTALTNFIAAISDPSLAADTRKEDNVKLSDLIDKTRLHLDTKLDVLMRLFEASDPYFYKTYRDARAIDTNGSAQAPTVEKDVDASGITTIYTMPKYNADTLFTFQNTSEANDVLISLSKTDGTEGPTLIAIPSGETRQRLASNLAADGTFLVISNHDTVPAHIKIWVE